MAKKESGLGRGLGELLDDNTPEIRTGKGSVVLKNGEERIRLPPPEAQPKPLFSETPKGRSIKSNFRK
jgi:hypothetical protein